MSAHATDVWVSLGVAVVLGITAAAIALWPTQPDAKAAAQSVAPTSSARDPLPEAPTPPKPSEAQSSPLRFTNPFDPSEVFEFPPGTSEDAARQSVAEMLLQRARDRQAQIGIVKHAQVQGPELLRAPVLLSER